MFLFYDVSLWSLVFFTSYEYSRGEMIKSPLSVIRHIETQRSAVSANLLGLDFASIFGTHWTEAY